VVDCWTYLLVLNRAKEQRRYSCDNLLMRDTRDWNTSEYRAIMKSSRFSTPSNNPSSGAEGAGTLLDPAHLWRAHSNTLNIKIS